MILTVRFSPFERAAPVFFAEFLVEELFAAEPDRAVDFRDFEVRRDKKPLCRRELQPDDERREGLSGGFLYKFRDVFRGEMEDARELVRRYVLEMRADMDDDLSGDVAPEGNAGAFRVIIH